MRTATLLAFWAVIFAGAAVAVARWARHAVNGHVNAALTPERLAHIGHTTAAKTFDAHADEALELVVQGQVSDVLRAAEAIKRGAVA